MIILTPSYDICLTCLILHHVHISPPLLDGKLSVGREHILFIFVYSIAHGFQQIIFECAQQAHSEAMRLCRCVHTLRAHLSQCIFLSSSWLTFWPVAFHWSFSSYDSCDLSLGCPPTPLATTSDSFKPQPLPHLPLNECVPHNAISALFFSLWTLLSMYEKVTSLAPRPDL